MSIPQNEVELFRRDFKDYLECLGFETQSYSTPPTSLPTTSLPQATSAWATMLSSVESCQKCPLHLERKQAVFGTGSNTAKIVFVSEAPTQSEEEEGRVLTGATGELFGKMIKAMNLSPDSYFLTHAAKCRPPHNRHPEVKELEQCSLHLRAQLEYLDPQVVVALGSVASKALLGPHFDFDKQRGNFFPHVWAAGDHKYSKCPILPTFHPAYLLRNADAKKLAWEDLKKVMAHLK